MSELPVRLALVGTPAEVAVRAEAMRRVRRGRVARIADSMEAALQNADDFDAVVVRSVVDAQRATESGLHILVDAPVADSTEQAELLLHRAQQAGVVLQVGCLPRNAPANRTIIDRLRDEKLGEAGMFRVHRWTSNREHSLAAKTFGDIDLAVCLFGTTPTEVYAIGRGNHSYVQIHLGFPRGGMAVLDYATTLPGGQDYDSLSLIGSQGAAYSDDHHNTHLLFGGRSPQALISDAGNGHLQELQAFVDKVTDGAAPSIDESILSVHHVIDAVAQSIDSTQVLHKRRGVYEPA